MNNFLCAETKFDKKREEVELLFCADSSGLTLST